MKKIWRLPTKFLRLQNILAASYLLPPPHDCSSILLRWFVLINIFAPGYCSTRHHVTVILAYMVPYYILKNFAWRTSLTRLLQFHLNDHSWWVVSYSAAFFFSSQWLVHISIERCFVYNESTTGYLKNHWTNHRLVCTHYDAFSMLIPNMCTIVNKSEIFDIFLTIF